MPQTLRDEMAALMPSLRWTQGKGCTSGMVGRKEAVWVCLEAKPRGVFISIFGFAWTGHMKSPALAATTIRRKLREFRAVIDKAIEETT